MRRICVALALVMLAGCGGADSARQATGAKSAPPPASPSDGAPPLAGGGGIEAAPEIDSIAIRLSKACRAVQRALTKAPETTGPKAAAANAMTDHDVLVALAEKLKRFKIDARRAGALRQYLTVLGHEIAVDVLIAKAGDAGDQAAVDDLNEQNAHNRRKRRQLADQQLAARGCRPGMRITD
jgi:hypothetical protein